MTAVSEDLVPSREPRPQRFRSTWIGVLVVGAVLAAYAIYRAATRTHPTVAEAAVLANAAAAFFVGAYTLVVRLYQPQAADLRVRADRLEGRLVRLEQEAISLEGQLPPEDTSSKE